MNKITLGFFMTKSKTTIKGLLLLFVFLLMNSQVSWGQTPVPMSSQVGLTYTESFADISNWTNNFAAGIGASRWSSYPITAGGTANDGKRTTKASATFSTTTNGGVQKGTGNLVFLSTGSSTPSEAVALDFLMDFTGVNAGTLSFNWLAIDNSSGTRPTSLRIYWSIDNIIFTEITAAQIIDVQSASSGSITAVALPTNFNNSATARLRFYNHAGTITGSGNRDKISIDDVTVTALLSGSASPTLSADATANTVDNNLDISFTDDSTWRTAVTAVKIGATTLTSGTDYDLTEGNLQLKPSGLNALLTASGSKLVTVVATGYSDATVTQVINAGVPTANSTAIISAALVPNTTRTITCTAKDQYNNLVAGYAFRYDAAITNNDGTTTESYTLDGTSLTTTTSNVSLVGLTNASGIATFSAALPATIDANDGISIQTQLSDGTTNIGSAFTFNQLASQTITFDALTPVTYGDAAFELTATASSSLPVSYASSNTAVATISGSTVTIVGAGSTNITASQVGNESYNAAANVIQPLTVNTIALTLPDAVAVSKVYTGTNVAVITGTLTGIINSDNVTLTGAGTFADANVANGIAVTSTSTLAGTKAGNYSLTQPTGLTANITQASQTITFGALANKTTVDVDYSPGATSATSGTNPIAYASSNPAVATIVAGNIHIVGAGSTTITASQAASSNYFAATDVPQLLTVVVPPLATWNFTTDLSPTSVSSNLGISDLSQGNNNGTTPILTNTSISSVYVGASGGNNAGASARTGVLSTGANGSAYFEFTVTPTSGYYFSLSGISFGSRSTSTGPVNYSLRSSADSYGSDLAIGSMSSTSSWTLYSNSSITSISTNGVPFTYRIYGYSGTGSASANTANWRIDDLTLTGTVSCVTPTAFAVTGGGNVCAPAGVDVGLDNSEVGVNYQLKLDGIDSGSPVSGTGAAISFGDQTASGIYTVEATNVNSGCSNTATMTGTATVSVATGATTAIPDPNFEQALIDLGLDCGIDGQVFTSNISSVTELDVSGLGITNLTGIEAFSSLQDLYCADNALTSLNVSMLSNLRYLDLENNLLTSLNVLGLTKLETLVCWKNKLASLNLSNNPVLSYLDCDDNAFEVLDVSKLTNLVDFYCSGNSLTSLDVRGLTSLEYFECMDNLALSCILVDDVAAATTLESAGDWAKDATAAYSYCDCSSPITWDGNAWSNGTGPTSTTSVIIAGNYNVSANIEACSLTINTDAVVVIPSGFNVTLNAPIIVNSGSFTLENNANLIQTNKNSINSGVITVNRNSNSLKRLDYTMWSSPVANQNLLDFSPMTTVTPDSRFFTYNSATNFYNSIVDPSALAFAKGSGYLIRMPNTDPTSGYDAGTTSITYPGVFTGLPNNGDVTIPVTAATYNAIGNPYPSAISADDFITANGVTEALYFWRKTNNVNQATAPTTSYATYTFAGGTGTDPSTLGGVVPNGTIQVGQGFIAKSTSTSLIFTNAMRTANNTNQIFKIRKTVERNRIWLNLTNPAGAFSQMMVAYMTDATQGIDAGIDGRYFNDSSTALNSFLDNEEFVIQGRALPFDGTDIVPLAFKTNVAGDYTIAIDHVDGLFSGSQDVVLKDNNTGTETNLKTGSYTFTAAAGADNSRFSLKFQKTLKVDAPAFNDNSVTVYKNKGALFVNSSAMAIANVKVFDIQGRLIAEQKNVKANTATISNLKATQQVLIVKVTGTDNTVVNKKVVN